MTQARQWWVLVRYKDEAGGRCSKKHNYYNTICNVYLMDTPITLLIFDPASNLLIN